VQCLVETVIQQLHASGGAFPANEIGKGGKALI